VDVQVAGEGVPVGTAVGAGLGNERHRGSNSYELDVLGGFAVLTPF
jgi:hypothetical protein